MSETLKRVLIILSASILFGFYPPAARGAYADGANSVFIILLTTFIRGLSMAGLCLTSKQRLFANKKDAAIALRSGFIQALSIVGILWSLVYLPGPVTIILLFTSTLMLLFFMWLKGEVEVNTWLFVTTAACLVGLTFVVDLWHTKTSNDFIGYALAMLGAGATASRLYIFGKLTKSKPPMVVGAETFLCAFLFLLVLPIYQAPILPHSMAGWGWAILCAGTLSLGSVAMFYGIAKVGPFYFSLYNKMEPVFAAIFSALLIGEILKTSQYIGIVIVIVSLVTYQVWDHRRKYLAAL